MPCNSDAGSTALILTVFPNQAAGGSCLATVGPGGCFQNSSPRRNRAMAARANIRMSTTAAMTSAIAMAADQYGWCAANQVRPMDAASSPALSAILENGSGE